MRYVLVHPEIGVFLGAVQMPENRIFYWSALSAPEDVTTALLFDNEEQALTALHDNNLALHFGDDLVEVHAVEVGDYEELTNMGFKVTAMTFTLPQHSHYDHIVPVGVIQ